jgi:hypothetical protein
MHARTAAALDRLEKAEWFAKCGMRDASTAKVLGSWKDACQCCLSIESENFRLEALNQYREKLCAKSPGRFAKWNEFVDELEPAIRRLTTKKGEPILRKYKLSEDIAGAVYRDILGMCMETEYAEIQAPGHHANVAFWYLNGHFPCGCQGVKWDGPYVDLYPPGFYSKIVNWFQTGAFGDWQGQNPQGTLIVY